MSDHSAALEAKIQNQMAGAAPFAVWTPRDFLAGGAGYGAQFWLYGGLNGLPADAYSPNGALGQYAMIVPSKKVIVVRRGLDGAPGFDIARFSADVLDALGRK